MSIVLSNQGNCHWFEPYVPPVDNSKSFTMSYAIKGSSWVFFHDYCPDMYLHTREKLYSLKNGSVYLHNSGVPGVYYDNTPKPYFIDVVFQADFDLILETVNWMTEFLDGQTDQPFNTLSHISVWNSHQHSGRVSLSKVLADKTMETRKTKGEWTFTDFRNILVSKGPQFLKDIFHDFALDASAADTSQAWYRKEVLTDKWFCVRFEFDNQTGKTLVLSDTKIQAIKSDR